MKHRYHFLLIFFTFLSIIGLHTTVQAQSDSSPNTVLLLGVDTGDLGRVEQGRSDTMMVVHFSQSNHSALLASIPRDAYVNIPGYGMDKINHAYAFGGADLSLQAVNGLLGTDVQSYVAVNMAGLKEIIDVVGTITVVPPTSFTIGEFTFTAGEPTELTSDMALAYARERYTSGGDYARQERQREIVQAIINKVASFDSIVHYIPMVSALSENITTNLSLNELVALFNRYKNLDLIESYQLSGYGERIDGIYYDQIDSDSLYELQNLLSIQ